MTKLSDFIIIPIDRGTIKPNPNYGKRFINGRTTTTLDYLGEIPAELREWLNPLSIALIGNTIVTTCQIIGNPDLFKNNPNCQNIKTKTNLIDVSPSNSHEYLYKYKKTLLECSNCKSHVAHDYIDSDYDENGDVCECCPVCSNVQTFPAFKYEKIEDVLSKV